VRQEVADQAALLLRADLVVGPRLADDSEGKRRPHGADQFRSDAPVVVELTQRSGLALIGFQDFRQRATAQRRRSMGYQQVNQ
jgi:hypothetical protein